MKTVPFMSLWLLLMAILPASPQVQQLWQQSYDGPEHQSDAPVALTVEADGKVIVFGMSGSATNGNDLFLVKYSELGTVLWSSQYSSTRNDVAVGMAADADRNILVTARSYESTNWWDVRSEFLTMKYDPAGRPLWEARHRFTDGSFNIPRAIIVDPASAVYVLGEVLGPTTGSSDFGLVKYSPQGATLWSRSFNGPNNTIDRAVAIATDASANIYIGGTSTFGYPDLRGHFTLVKYDTDGNLLWTAITLPSTNAINELTSLHVDAAGNAVVAGTTSRQGGDKDWLIIRYDNTGHEIWSVRYGGLAGGDDVPSALASDRSGGILVAGESDEGWRLQRYDSAGKRLWSAHLGMTNVGRISVKSLVTDVDGNAYVAGEVGYSAPGINPPPPFLVGRFNPQGVRLWSTRVDDAAGFQDSLAAIAVSPVGDVVLSGRVARLILDHFSDALTVKYSQTFPTGFPAIITPPQYVEAVSGQTATLTVSADGVSPLSYQWLFNGRAILEATGPMLVLTNLKPTQDGEYSVSVSNPLGSVTSPDARIRVLGFFEEPLGQSIVLNSVAAFNSRPSGSPSLYQWLFNGVPLLGAHQPTLSLTDVESARSGDYAVVISGDSLSVTSRTAHLDVSALVRRKWVRRITGSVFSDVYHDTTNRTLAVDRQGNIYEAGIAREAPRRYEISRINPDGTEAWVRAFGGDGPGDVVVGGGGAYATDVTVDGAGNAFVVGTVNYIAGYQGFFPIINKQSFVRKYTSSGVAAGFGSLDEPEYDPRELFDAFVAPAPDGGVIAANSWWTNAVRKYTASVLPAWSASYPSRIRALTTDLSGNIYVAGEALSASNGTNFGTAKFASTGALLWTAQYDGPAGGNDVAIALGVDSAGNVFVAGTSDGGATGNNFALIKYNPGGSQSWAARYNSFGADTAQDLALGPDGDIYVVGDSPGAGSGRDIVTVKFSPAGTVLWAARYNGPAKLDDTARRIAVATNGNVYVVGTTTGSPSFNKQDYLTLSYDANGTLRWQDTFNGPDNSADFVTALAVQGISIFVAGSSRPWSFATLRYDESPLPYVGDVRLLSNGLFSFNFYGEPGAAYTFERSADLVNWETLTNLVNGQSVIPFGEAATNARQNFYRAVRR